jgi:predicted nuclease of predicted toxin-antitoxin system
VKLLLDENLSHALIGLLASHFSPVSHVRDLGLKSASDTDVWAYCRELGLTIVTKDADFHHRSILLGHPPKVIWVRLGNCSTKQVAELLIRERTRIENFLASAQLAFLSLP